MTEKIEVIIWFETSAKPEQHGTPSHTEKEEFETLEDAKEFIKQHVHVDNLETAGNEFDNRKEYGYWSICKDRQTGKKWYERATVEIRKLKREKIDINEVL